MRAVIIANGELNHPDLDRKVLRRDDLVIAADGGVRNCRFLGTMPGLIIGDLDSLPAEELETLAKAGTEIIRHPERKDQTDLELALGAALDRGADEIVLLGALGARWDMTLANLLLLTRPELEGVKVSLVDGRHEIYVLRGQDALTVQGKKGDILSLIPVGGNAVGVTLSGLEYPLNADTIPLGSTWGVSNVLLSEKGVISLRKGLLFCLLMHKG